MKRTFIGIPVFGIMLAIILGMLQLLNWIPSAIEEGSLREYRSIDDVRSRLKIRPLLVPVYYPKNIRWPPSFIAAQARPYEAVVMEFLLNEGDQTALVITQTALPHPPLEEKMRFNAVRESVRFAIKGRTVLLEVGTCRVDELCSRIGWREGLYQIALGSILPPSDLVRLAESMVVGLQNGGAVKERGPAP